MNLLLIDSRVSDKNSVIKSLISETKYIIFDYKKDNIEDIYNQKYYGENFFDWRSRR